MTTKARSLVTAIVFSSVGESRVRVGRTAVETIPVPRGLQSSPPVAAPRSRYQIPRIEVVVATSAFCKKFESGTWTPLIS